MLKHLQQIFEAEYHQLSYWYFFFFAIGIIYSISNPIPYPIAIGILLPCLISLLIIHYKESPLYIWFLLLCTIMFCLGAIATQYRIDSTQAPSIITSQIVALSATYRKNQAQSIWHPNYSW
jgi:hypothetical protein